MPFTREEWAAYELGEGLRRAAGTTKLARIVSLIFDTMDDAYERMDVEDSGDGTVRANDWMSLYSSCEEALRDIGMDPTR